MQMQGQHRCLGLLLNPVVQPKVVQPFPSILQVPRHMSPAAVQAPDSALFTHCRRAQLLGQRL